MKTQIFRGGQSPARGKMGKGEGSREEGGKRKGRWAGSGGGAEAEAPTLPSPLSPPSQGLSSFGLKEAAASALPGTRGAEGSPVTTRATTWSHGTLAGLDTGAGKQGRCVQGQRLKGPRGRKVRRHRPPPGSSPGSLGGEQAVAGFVRGVEKKAPEFGDIALPTVEHTHPSLERPPHCPD